LRRRVAARAARPGPDDLGMARRTQRSREPVATEEACMTLEVSLTERTSTDGLGALAASGTLDRAAPVEIAGVVHDLGNLIQIASSVLSIVSRSPDMPAARRDPMLVKASTSLDHAGA